MRIWINEEDIILLHKKVIDATGGSQGIRDAGLIQSAVRRANMTFEDIELYPDIIDKIAVITYSLIKNHGAVDGNKRMGIATMLLLCQIHGVIITYTQKELSNLGWKVADETIGEEHIKCWIRNHKS